MSSHATSKTKEDSAAYVSKIYKQFVSKAAIDYENSKLETKYPEFNSLMKEYRDGILLFGLTDDKVWSKAVKDTVGLKDFYDKNKQNYMWDERLDATIYTCANEDVAKETHKLMKAGKLTDDEILKEINKTNIKLVKHLIEFGILCTITIFNEKNEIYLLFSQLFSHIRLLSISDYKQF